MIDITGFRIPAVFGNLESQDWQHTNPRISGLQS